MSTDYGIDIAAAESFPERDEYVRGVRNVGYALARRLLTPSGGLADCGDETEYRSLDLRSYIGARLSAADVLKIEREAAACCNDDERVEGVTVALSFGQGELTATLEATAIDGETFRLILNVNAVTVELLEDE